MIKNMQENTLQENNENILISYSAENPEHPSWYIYEYQTGRKVLVEIDSESGKVHFLKEL